MGCSSPKGSNFSRRNLGEYFISSGVVKHLLPELPSWANYSHSGQCRRNSSTRFLDYSTLRNSFSLSYSQASHFQHMFNIQNVKTLSTFKKADYIPFKEEETIFYSISDKVEAGVRSLILPKFNRVHLIWIDRALNDKNELSRLKKLLKKKVMQKGHPVFVSLCLAQHELEEFVKENGMQDLNARLIPFELFSPYDAENNELGINLQLNFDRIFRTDQSLHLFIPKVQIPPEFIGNFKIHPI